MRFNKPLVGLAVAAMFALTACGGGSGSSSEEPTDNIFSNSAAPGDAMDPTAKGPLTIDGATQGGVVHVIGSSGDMSTSFDPRGVYYSDVISIQTSLIVRSLTQWKYDDATGNMVLVPDLATNLGESNSDYTQWTFHLQPGLKYSDGTPIKAQDIAYSVSSSLDCDTFSDCPSNYFLGGVLKGSDTVKQGQIASGIETPDDNTIIFNFSQPFPDMSYYAFFPLFSPIPKDKGKDLTGYQNHLLAEGPYMVKSYSPGKSLDLVRNPNWDPATDPARTAYPDEYIFDTTYTDPKKVDALIMSDQGSTTMSYDDIDSSDIKTFQGEHPDQVASGPTPLTEWLAPDNSKVPLAVRQAIAWAYPYEAAAKAAGLIPGVNWLPTTTVEAPGVPGRQEINPIDGHEAGQTDAQKAHDILEQAGKLGFKVSWLYDTDIPSSVKGMQIVSKAYKAAGLDPEPVATTSTDYAAKRSDPNTPVNIRTGGWFSDWPSGYSWIPPVFAPPQAGVPCAKQKWDSFGVVNYAKFCEDDINQQIKAVEAMPQEDQPAAWSDLEKTIQTKYYPVIPMYNGGVIQGHGTAIQGVNIDVTGGMPTWKTIWVQQ
jgi:peptide/nickel transport system substrate-binding protein